MSASPSIVDTPEEAAAQERPPLLVRQPLEAVLDAAGIGSGPIEADPIGDGHSNITYLIRRGDAEVVLRRPPRPPLPPSAHDVIREARLLRALESQPVRTPRVLLIHEDETTIGGPFYVMERVAGDVISTTLPERFVPESTHAPLIEELVDALVELHAVDWRGAGLEWFGKGDDRYLERQLRRFGGLWELNATRAVPEVEETAAWLAERRPVQRESTLVHGDYRLGNVMFGPGSTAGGRDIRLTAIFDWELSTIGDPLADVGYLTATYNEGGGASGPMAELTPVTAGPGFPSRAQILERYAAGSGRELAEVGWYQALAIWKSAVFLEGSYKRHRAGSTDDPFFAALEQGVPLLARHALELAQGSAA
ncbi:aminoglycoside phosphotransferase [Patulibacter medicamentivorans]|jgi:aminoglycoside phosphotransferase (APT) family kinase protein|uniref:Aminoglycoside phosphotransferase n=1 Tax=Patulibacter medicamentivorans TaxID=1097667 RepID=H0E0R6_9ACTN|nr:phosphotransferase family protein [Patulibacter medicamentivorans]EHN12680.1 aminoglycoside phosphotransferase [Patulibacter medicamentivorans]